MSQGTPPKSSTIAPGAPPGAYEIPLGAPPKANRTGGPSYAKPPERSTPPAKGQVGDSSVRETVETVVFVVVLVLLLKTFLAEAFVIPTGSMATTLLGYHVETNCEKCGYKYVFNASSVAEPQQGQVDNIFGSWCPNCQAYNPFDMGRRGGPDRGGPGPVRKEQDDGGPDGGAPEGGGPDR